VRTVIYETENAIFRLNKSDVINRLKVHSKEYNISQATELLSLISSSSEVHVRIPEKNNYFRYICLYLVDQGKGSVICNLCRKSYQLTEIRIIRRISGWVNWPKWIMIIFSKEQKPRIGNFGGIGIQCEKGHELLGMAITWIS